MAKRKRDGSKDDNDQNETRHKKSKRASEGVELPQSDHGAKSHRMPLLIGTSTQVAGHRHSATLEPPPGLSKAQRKRWRKRQKKHASSESTDVAKRRQPSNLQSSSEEVKQPFNTVATKRKKPKSAKHRFSSKRHAVTHLMLRPKRIWREETMESLTSDAKPMQQRRKDLGQELLRKTDSKESLATSESVMPTHTRRAGEASGPKEQCRQEQNQPARAHSTGAATILNAMPYCFGSRNTLAAHPGSFFRRPSSGNKSVSVPSYSDNMDVKESFKRFSAFVEGSDSSDDESESSESEIDGGVKAAEQPRTAATTTTNLNPRLTARVSSSGEPIRRKGTFAVKDDVERRESNEDDILPRFSPTPSKPAPVSASLWPANVGIKRQVSFGGQESSRRRSGTGVAVKIDAEQRNSPARPSSFSYFDEPEQSTQDILQAVDEISKDVFGSTRPLPASKPPLSPGPTDMDHENGVLTVASSDRRVTRSMSTSNSPETRKDIRIGPRSPMVVICNTVRILDGDFASHNWIESITPERHDDSPGHTSDNIDVAAHGPASGSTGQTASSSSLSELSRSPSPPASGTDVKDAGLHDGADIQSPRREDTEPGLEAAPSILPLKKKRQMTGRTSKHFTSEKRKRSRPSFIKAESEQDLALGRDAGDDMKDVDADAQDVIRVTQAAPVKPEKRKRRTRSSLKVEERHSSGTDNIAIPDGDQLVKIEATADQEPTEILPPVSSSTRAATKKKRKSTGKRSAYFTPTKPPKPELDLNIIDRVDIYNTTAGNRKKRVPAGTSTAPVPSINSPRFGIIQEKLWQEPFWLLIAVTFLNKTTGRAAVPVFWALKERYPTPEALAGADEADLHDMIYHLGLQRQRSKRLLKIANAWVDRPPEKGRRYRTLHYPVKGDGKVYKAAEVVEEDADECEGALEIGHIPGCGPYAWDSWRIFCRDSLRGLADDYNGKNAGNGFLPEWQKVLPLDKELRACLRWMWLRAGWIWDHETGRKRRATAGEMEKAVLGEMDISDPQERKFAALAAGVEIVQDHNEAKDVNGDPPEAVEVEVGEPSTIGQERPSTPVQNEETDLSDNIYVTPPRRRAVRRSDRLAS